MTRGRVRRVLLLCGGRSDEHEVSLASAASVLEAAPPGLVFDPRVIGRDGRALSPGASRRALGVADAAPDPARELADGAGFDALDALAPLRASGADAPYDAVFPLLHGPHGEDGTVQGLLTLSGIPFVGSGVLGSAVGMDKPTMKAVFAAHGLPQVAYATVTAHAWRRAPEAEVARLAALPWPRFVKPANLGSSVGINPAEEEERLRAAVAEALRFDRRAIVEEGVVGGRELEVAVLGNARAEASPVGEIVFEGAFYDYATKYTDGAARLTIPADVPERVAERCRALALDAFAAVDAAGLARVDFFWDPVGDRVLVNEINTMPGFTRTSMYPKLWRAAGLDYPQLIERLVELALERG